jgi:Subtilase family
VDDKKVIVAVILILAIAIILTLPATISKPSQDLIMAFGEPKAFEQYLKSCVKESDSTISPSSDEQSLKSCVKKLYSTISPSSDEPAEPLRPTDQASLIAYCSENACSPNIIFGGNADYYQRPYKNLVCNDALLELKPAFYNLDIKSLANVIAQTVKVLHVIDLPDYKAITVEKSPGNSVLLDRVTRDNRFLVRLDVPCEEYILQIPPGVISAIDRNNIASLVSGIERIASEVAKMPGVVLVDYYAFGDYYAVAVRTDESNKILKDQRFLKYDLGSYAGAGQPTPVSGHIAQLQWSQTLPNGFKRTVPINATQADNEARSPANETQVNADIAILDTGVSLHHPDLNVYRNVSFVDGVNSGNDDNGHGSHVAGIAAARDNSVGIVGVAPGARIWAIKVCDALGECKMSNQIKGIEYATKHADEIDVLNISIENPNSPALNNALAQAVKAGITVVVSAGNYGVNAASTSPANSPNALTVSAIGDSDGKCGGSGPIMEEPKGTVSDDTFAFFSNFGPVVKMAAPGVKILSTYNGTNYGVESGTSMAAPYVAGAAALYKAEFPDALPSEVIANVTASGTLPGSVCDEGPRGYFEGDTDGLHEPLLLRSFRSPTATPTDTKTASAIP